MGRIVIAFCLVGLAGTVPAPGFATNETATLVLHAVESGFGPCDIPDPCDPGPPTVDVMPGTDPITIYLLVRNGEEVAGVQTAFDFSSWLLLFGVWSCQINQVTTIVPQLPGGPNEGTLATTFDCIYGGQSEVIGRMVVLPLEPGCVTQVESIYPNGTHLLNCLGEATPVAASNRGMICGPDGGLGTCNWEPAHNVTPWCNAGGPYTGSAGLPLELDGSRSLDPDGEIVDWSWDFGDGHTGSGSQPTHTYAVRSLYTVQLEVTDDAGGSRSCATEADIGEPVAVGAASWGAIKVRHR